MTAIRSQSMTKIEFSHSPVPPGQGFAVKATVSAAGPHHVHGDVEFFVDGKSVATRRTDRNGVAIYEVPGGLLSAGDHEIYATFHGDAKNESSTAETLVAVLAPAPGETWPGGKLVESAPVVQPEPLFPLIRPAPQAPIMADNLPLS